MLAEPIRHLHFRREASSARGGNVIQRNMEGVTLFYIFVDSRYFDF